MAEAPDFIPDEDAPDFIPDDHPAVAAGGSTPSDAPDFISDKDAPDFIPDDKAPPQVESSLPGAITRDVVKSAPSIAGSLAGVGPGVALGTAVAPFLGPLAPAGPVIGGIVGAMGGGWLANSVADFTYNQFGFKKGHGFFSDEQAQADAQQHPWAKDIADLGTTAATFAVNPAASVGQRLLGGGIQGGMEAGQQLYNGEFDPSEIALRTAEGMVFTDPRRATAAYMRPFEQAAQKAITRAGVTAPQANVGTSETPPPPAEDPNAVGNNAGERSDREYPKEQEAPTNAGVTTGESFMTPDFMAALDTQNGRNMTEGPVKGSSPLPGDIKGAPEEQAPVKTGLAGLNGVPPEVTATVTPEQARAMPDTELNQQIEQAAPQTPAPQKPGLNNMSDEDVIDLSRAQRDRAAELAPTSPYTDTAPQSPRYKHPVVDGMMVNRTVPKLPGTARLKGNELFVDSNLPRSIQVSGKGLDPAVPLGIREKAYQHALHTQDQIPGGRNMDPAQKRQFARENADHHMNDWLNKNGYDPKEFASKLPVAKTPAPVERTAAPVQEQPSILKGLKGEPAPEQDRAPAATGGREIAPENPEVTATVTPKPRAPLPPVVEMAVKELRARERENPRMGEAADAIEAAHPDEQANLATMAMRHLQSRGGNVAAEAKVARVPSKPAQASNGVTARTRADAERIDRALLAADRGMEKAAPVPDDFDPRDRTKVAALKENVKAALEQARSYNRGQLPHDTYKPTRARGQNVQQPTPSWLWSRAADQFLKGKIKAADFAAQDKLYRSGNAEDAKTGMMGNRVEADIAKSRRSGDEAVADAENKLIPNQELVPAEDMPAGSKTPITNAGDLTKFEGKVEEQHVADTSTVLQNVVKTYQPRGHTLERQLEDEARWERTGQLRRAREAGTLYGREGEAPAKPKSSDGRSVPVNSLTAEAKKAAVAAMEKAVARNESLKASRSGLDALPPEPPKKPADLADFFKNQDGTVNYGKINSAFKVKLGEIKEGLNKLFGLTFNNVQRHFDPILAGAMSLHAKLSAEKAHLLDARWYQWNKQAKEDVWRYLDVLETQPDTATHKDFMDALKNAGVSHDNAKWMADEALFHRSVMDQIYNTDQHFVQNYERLEGYVAHQFEDPKGVQDFLDQRRQALGATWFTKDRVFDTIKQAEAAGFKLRHQNPIDIITSRWASSINDWMIVSTLRKLNTEGLAYPVADKNTPAWAQKSYVKVANTPDGVAWMIAPEGKNLWENAMMAKSLFDKEGATGNVFRGWMKLKNVWMPLQLGLSLFHEVHVAANINPVQNLVRASRVALKTGDITEIGSALKNSFADPLLALPLEGVFKKLGFDNLGKVWEGFEGKQLIKNWNTDPANLSPVDRTWQNLIQETGARLEQNEDTISATRALAKAWKDQSYPGVAGAAIRRGIQATQDWMMKYQIPALKAIALKRDIEAAFRIDPTLASDHAKRRIVMRQIGQNIDDRFGEMFYKSLFWNRIAKDAGIASFLSLSWNVGQVRQASGALHDAFDMGKMATGLGAQPSGARRIQVLSNDRVAFVSGYIAMSMLASGGLSWALSGQLPSGTDWLMPRNGEKNPDGTPARLTVPFNTREGPMLVGHTQEAGNVISGLGHMIYNKMILAPIFEAAQNRDFFGRELYDQHAPWYKRALQLVDSELLNHTSPIATTGADRAKQLGGGVRDEALAYAGFGPAPAYISHDAMQNAIQHDYYDEHGTKSYEYGKKTGLGRGLIQNQIRGLAGDKLESEGRQQAFTKLNRSYATDDKQLGREARRDLVREGGVSQKTAGTTKPDQEFQRLFRSLSMPRQVARFKDMTDEQKQLYVYRNPLMGTTAKARLLREAGVR